MMPQPETASQTYAMGSYEDATIYFMSGTGNSARIANHIGTRTTEAGVPTRVISIEEARPEQELAPKPGSLLGLVMPTHGFTAPWLMIKFAARLPPGRGAHAFSVATRASLKVGPVCTPGISGSGTFLMALMLAFKGYRPRGILSVDMPSNWFTLHPMQSTESHEAIIDRGRRISGEFTERLLAGRRAWVSLNNLYEAFWAVALLLISLGYLYVGRMFLAKLFFANGRCTSCGLCARSCPVSGVVLKGEEKKARPYWTFHCESCMRCAAFCKEKAIESGHSVAAILISLSVLPIWVYVLAVLRSHFPGVEAYENHWARRIVEVAWYYPAVVAGYFAIWLALHVRPIRWAFTVTTLTHFWGRYRAPGIKLRDLRGRAKKKNREALDT